MPEFKVGREQEQEIERRKLVRTTARQAEFELTRTEALEAAEAHIDHVFAQLELGKLALEGSHIRIMNFARPLKFKDRMAGAVDLFNVFSDIEAQTSPQSKAHLLMNRVEAAFYVRQSSHPDSWTVGLTNRHTVITDALFDANQPMNRSESGYVDSKTAASFNRRGIRNIALEWSPLKDQDYLALRTINETIGKLLIASAESD